MRPLPGTDLSLFPLVLGGNVFGWSADRDESFAVLDAYVAAGGNIVDTADVYSAWQGTEGGESETIVGEWLRSRGNRDQLLIATKVGKAPGLDNLRPDTIRTAIERSLRRLGTDRVDLYYAHQDHPDPMDDALETFDALVREGKTRYVAASQYGAARLGEALDLSSARGWAPYVALQTSYNLVDRRQFETELAPTCAARGLAVLPYFGLARGYLTGKYRVGGPAVTSVRAEGVTGFRNAAGERVLDALEGVAARHDVAPAAVALAWLLTRPTVVAPLASARTPDQLAALLPMATLVLSADDLAVLDAASDPTPPASGPA